MTHTTLSSDSSRTRRLALAGVFTALAIVGSFLSFPVAGSKCAPVQHIINILAAVTLGPWYSVTKSAWSWQHDGFSRKYGWSTLLWTCILHLPQAQPDLSCRGTRHRNSWRPGCLSCCSIYYGNHSCRDLRLCSSISDFYYCRKHSCISADYSAE